jgi:sugar phosphate isomerase/epimerase
VRILDLAARQNGAVLVDAIHFFRAGDTPQGLSRVPRKRLRYAQLCDAKPEKPAQTEEVIARRARTACSRAKAGSICADCCARSRPAFPLSLEVPVSQKLPPLERARRALDATKAILVSAEGT